MELAKFQNQNTYYNYLKNYLNNGKNIEEISVPIANNSDDESIRNLINKLINVQIKKDVLIEGGQHKNPAIVQYNRTTNQLILNIHHQRLVLRT